MTVDVTFFINFKIAVKIAFSMPCCYVPNNLISVTSMANVKISMEITMIQRGFTNEMTKDFCFKINIFFGLSVMAILLAKS